MLDISLLRTHSQKVKQLLADRVDTSRIDDLLSTDEQWRNARTALDKTLAEHKTLSQQAGVNPEAREQGKAKKIQIEEQRKIADALETKRDTLLLTLPNIPLNETPKGKTEDDKLIIKTVGEPPVFSFTPKSYLSLIPSKDIKLKEGAVASGARFNYLTGYIAKLAQAVIHFTLHELVSKQGFELVFPPTLLQSEVMRSMGYLDQTAGRDEVFYIEKDDKYLIGTAEHALGALHMNQTLKSDELPKRYVAYTPCYRREAGSYGKDTKGIMRLHQFEKIEMFSLTKPQDSEKEHAFFLSLEEKLMSRLGLHYRVVDLPAGDLGFPSARTFDIETWLPGQRDGKGEFRETHSTSNCTDYQARRLHIRYTEGKKTSFVHMVNGTAFALERILIAIMEQYQQENGSVTTPQELTKFLL